MPIPIDTSPPSMHDAQSPIAFLRSPYAIRQRAESVLTAGLRGELSHFDVDLERLAPVIDQLGRGGRTNYRPREASLQVEHDTWTSIW